MSRQLHDLIGIYEGWLYDARYTPFHQEPLFRSPSDLAYSVSQGTLLTLAKHPVTTLFVLMCSNEAHSNCSVYGTSTANPLLYDLLLTDVPFHLDTGAQGHRDLINFIYLNALLTSPELRPLTSRYDVWGRIYDKEHYDNIVNGDLHPSVIKTSFFTPWIEDVWDLQHKQRPYTPVYLSVVNEFKDHMHQLNVNTNADLAHHIKSLLHIQTPQ